MQKTRFDPARFDLLPFVIWQITRVLSICQMKLTQKQALEQMRLIAFGPLIVVARTLPLPLVITSI